MDNPLRQINRFYKKSEALAERAKEFVLRKQINDFYKIFGGHIFFQTLSSGVELDLFTQLSRRKKMNRQEIRDCLGIEEKPAKILLSGLTTLKLIRKKGDSYSNSSLANLLLNSDSEKNIIPYIRFENHIIYRPLARFSDSISANTNLGLEEFKGDFPTVYQRLANNPELEQIFQDSMEKLSRQVNPYLPAYLNLSKTKFLLDVGGGNGENIIQLARQYPNLQAAVFESPTVCETARENIRENKLESRLKAIEGNCFTDDFPEQTDAFLFSHFFTIWSEEKNKELLKKCYKTLPNQGKVAIFNMMQKDNEKGPLSSAMGSPYFLTLATGEGMIYPWKDYKSWIKETGFSKIQTYKLPRDHGLIIATK